MNVARMTIFRRRAKRTRLVSPDDQMTLIEHLAELRSRIIRSLLAVVIGVVVIIAAYDPVLRFLTKPYRNLCDRKGPTFCTADLQYLSPLEGFTTRLSIATYGGIILALPVIMWQIWRFVAPALHAREKRYAIPFVLSSVLLFVLGGFVAYWTLDKALEFLISWSGEDVNANFQVSKYISLVGLMVAAFGITFEFPVLLVSLQMVGVLSPQTLIRQWRYATVIIFALAAIITPSGDPYSMMALAIPMVVFYAISVVIGLVHQRRKRRREAVAD